MNSKTLAELRSEKNMTQRQLAKIIGLRPSTIAMYETGERTPPLMTAIKIAKLFDMPVENIFFGECVRRMRAQKATGTED